MRYRRLICFLFGAWIGVSLMLGFQVYENFDAVARVLRTPPDPLKQTFKIVTPDKARALLRYTAGVQTASAYDSWENIQFALGFVITGILLLEKSTRALCVATVAMIVIVAFEHLKLSPDIAWLGSTVEFVPWLAESHSRDQFWNLHRMYMILDGAKCVIGIGAATMLFLQQSGRHGRRRTQPREAYPDAETRRYASR